MKGLIGFLRATVAGGFFVVLPIVLVVALLAEAVGFLGDLLEPVLDPLPVRELGGVDVSLLVAGAVVLLTCFLTGLVIRTELGDRANRWIERTVLERLPGYTLIKSLTRRFAGTETSERWRVARARLGGGADSLVFVVDELESGEFTVLQPLAPTPTVGLVHVVKPEDLRILDVPFTQAVNSFMQWGVGSREFLKP
ncbi:MAG: hypothetical protein QNK04_07555 [Myxococcota bacterium]|nr:hypothetical protein [Myxococcota bacterium]